MEQFPYKLVFNQNEFPVKLRYSGYYEISENIQLSFANSKKYHVQTKVSDEVFHSLIDYLNDNKEPIINSDNIYEYIYLNNEFNLFTALIQNVKSELGEKFSYINFLLDETIQDRSFYEKEISKNLNFYILNKENEMTNLNVNSLYNIFNQPEAKSANQETAYQFIKKISNYDSKYLILFNSLDGAKLSKESQIECNERLSDRFGFCPKMDWMLSFKQEQDNFKKIVEKQQKEIFELKQMAIDIQKQQQEQLKFNELMQKQQKEIKDLKQTIVENEKKQLKFNELMQKHQKEIENLKQTIVENEKKEQLKFNELMQKHQKEIENLKQTIVENEKKEQLKFNELMQKQQKEIKDLKQTIIENEKQCKLVSTESISKTQNEIFELKHSLSKITESLEDKENQLCEFMYLSSTVKLKQDQKEEFIHIKAGESTLLPIFLMIPPNNSICTLESNTKGSKIIFKKSGMYFAFFNLVIKTNSTELKKAKITLEATYPSSHRLYFEQNILLNDEWTFAKGFKLTRYKENESTYIRIKSSIPIDIRCNASTYTTFGFIRVGAQNQNKVFNGFTQQIE